MVSPDGALPLPWLDGWLAQALRSQRSHALLIHGPAGIGQWQLSLTLAQAWLCDTPADGGRPCGHCASCRLVQARSHPDLLVLLPEALQVPLGCVRPRAGSTLCRRCTRACFEASMRRFARHCPPPLPSC